ncbi:MAG: DUF4982 domain-containing protein [Prevotella sp.]|nr:DUF4982 domain-containing protein [Prevotella sp.]
MKYLSLIMGLLALPLVSSAQTRQEYPLKQWSFSHDSVSWQPVTVPHDWAISGPFDKKWDLQMVAIEQNFEKEKTEKSGRSGALPWIGEGFYTTHLSLSDLRGRRATLVFDGAMAEPTVYVNGHRAGYWAYGYNAFRLDVTPFLKEGDNKIDVHLQNVEESSRWYPGAGIYRPVSLVVSPVLSIDPWGTFVRTLAADSTSAQIAVDAQLQGFEGQQGLAVEVSVLHPAGWVERACHASVDAQGHVHGEITLPNPRLWSPETPALYRVETRLYQQGRLVDATTLRTGVRTISVDSIHGFRLNGVSRKFKGVCLHHDLGPLGAAVNKSALIRQVRQLKDMGADAIRTAHNMPSQMQMEVYDSLGMMVMAESFDMWLYPKCKNGYARFFKDWADRDITNLVLANRNHPSLVMWSIGNEIPEQWSEEGRDISRHLQDLCHQLDPMRPVTQGMDRAEAALKSGFAQVMDVPGFNYRVYKYDRNMKSLHTGFLLGSETASTVSSRGVYKFPVTFQVAKAYADGQSSSYDTEWCSWSNLPEEDFMAEEDKAYDIGQFVWTGYDYLGEPTPYDEYWPSRSSYFGIMDLAGLPKDRYYLYRSVWNKGSHTLHILPHWTWPDRVGKTTPVFVYTDYPEGELFVNGKSQGRIRKAAGLKVDDQKPATGEVARQRATRYRLMWDDVKYQPGELRVVAYDANGMAADSQTVRTAGKASALRLVSDRPALRADGEDIAFVTVSLVDNNGTELPAASDLIKVSVSGAGTFRALCNGDATSLEPFTEPQMRLFSGKLVVLVQSSATAGPVTLTVSCPSRRLSQTLTLPSR